MRTLGEMIETLPPERRMQVETRSRQLIGEELALRQLRQALDYTQKNMAVLLGTDQASISKIENRSDMLLSTLRSYIEAMGGALRLRAEFPDGCVELKTLGEVGDIGRAEPTLKKRIRRLEGVSSEAE